MNRSSLKTLVLGVGMFVSLALLLEVSGYVLTISSVPSRIRGRIGNGHLALEAAQRQRAIALRPTPVVAAVRADADPSADESSGPMMFHPVLGWDYPANVIYRGPEGGLYAHGSDGERRTCTSFDTTAVATYGDSFTHCDEVPDEQTWQTFLSLKLRSNVLNYGVGGYGTDQAFLKFRLHGEPKAKVVMLCILPENINRVVNIYRPFYNYEDPLALTKPRFVCEGNGFRLMPNPIDHAAQLTMLENPGYLSALGTQDYWYQLDRKMPKIGFPYGFTALSWRSQIAAHASLIVSALAPGLCEPHYPCNLFDEQEPLAIMCHIVDLFVAEARDKGATPIIVIMPHKDYVREVMDFHASRVARFLKFLRKSDYPFVDLVQAMAEMKPSRAQLESWYTGHATADGNKVTADLLFQYLKNNRISASF